MKLEDEAQGRRSRRRIHARRVPGADRETVAMAAVVLSEEKAALLE
jgi:hypothetical protein